MRIRALIAAGLLLMFYQGSRADETDLAWCTLLGGTGRDMARGVAVDGSGSAYVTGLSESITFPTTSGVFDTTLTGSFDAFIAKIDPAGSDLAYTTFLGGLSFDEGVSIAVDGTGCAYLAGTTKSFDFPTTPQALDSTFNGDFDVFVAKISSSGSALDYATLMGGASEDGGYAIAIDNSGCIYLTGDTYSFDFPTVPWAFDTTHSGGRDAFAAKINPSADTLDYATFLGGTAEEGSYAIAVDPSGCAFLSGSTGSSDFPTTAAAFDTTHNRWDDAFVVKLDPAGKSLEYATFLGGRDYDQAYHIAIDHSGCAYLTGATWSENFPTTKDAFDSSYNASEDAFVVKLDPAGKSLEYATFLGGKSYDLGLGIVLDAVNNAFVTGYTKSSNFPTTLSAFDTSYNDSGDIFLARLDPSGRTLGYATYLGGSYVDYGRGIALDDRVNVYLAGHTWSDDFPTTDNAFATEIGGSADAFVAKLTLTITPVKPDPPPTMRPAAYALQQNFPNPFNATTEIRYHISTETHVTLTIFNTLGQEVKTLVDEDRDPGHYTATWDGRDHLGRKVASGLYLSMFTAGSYRAAVKMVLIR